MSVYIHKKEKRGTADVSWLRSAFSFSFSSYFDPGRMNFGKLRVFNDDVIAPGEGFGDHPHQNMEIITFVLEGTLLHQDSMGHK
jgi:hypothetical protein